MSYTQEFQFGLECSPLEIDHFISEIPSNCILCSSKIYQGHSLGHNNGNKLVFCEECFEELKLTIAILVVHEEERN